MFSEEGVFSVNTGASFTGVTVMETVPASLFAPSASVTEKENESGPLKSQRRVAVRASLRIGDQHVRVLLEFASSW